MRGRDRAGTVAMKALLLVLILDVLAVVLVLSDRCAQATPGASFAVEAPLVPMP